MPFARALRDAGHDLVVAAPASFASAVERAGFTHHPFAGGSAEEQGRVFAGLAGLSNEDGYGVVVRGVFARTDARAALPGITALLDQWQPDLVLRETAEFGSYVAAEEAGIPQVQVAIGLTAFDQLYSRSWPSRWPKWA